jgi:hypothetical protein
MKSLSPEVAPFGIRTMLVEPGFFRTELLIPKSTKYAEASVADYAERTEQTVTAWKSMNGQQGCDSAKLADALVHLATQDEPLLRPPAPTRSPLSRRRQGAPRPGRRPPRPVQQHRPRRRSGARVERAVVGRRMAAWRSFLEREMGLLPMKLSPPRQGRTWLSVY